MKFQTSQFECFCSLVIFIRIETDNSVLALSKDWGSVRPFFFCPYHNQDKVLLKSDFNFYISTLSRDVMLKFKYYLYLLIHMLGLVLSPPGAPCFHKSRSWFEHCSYQNLLFIIIQRISNSGLTKLLMHDSVGLKAQR